MLDSDIADRFEALMMPHLDDAYTLAWHLLRDEQDAQDVTQDAMLRALKYFASFRGESARAWLLAIVRNSCMTLRRARMTTALAEEFDETIHSDGADGEHPEAVLIRSATRDRVHAALAELPLEYREVVVLRELHDLPYREIAEIVGVPLGTVMSRLSRGRQRLARTLGSEGEQ